MKKLIMLLIIPLFFYCCEKDHPPTCEIISPEAGSEFIRGEIITVSVDANDSDGSVKEVRFYIDGMGITAVQTFPYNYVWDTGEVELGIHIIRAVAIDDENLEGETSLEIVIALYEPNVITGVVKEITSNSAICSGEVINDGGSEVSERGICWSVYPDPYINDNKVESGIGLGSFEALIDNLEPITSYYVKAYAINEKGTSYGEQQLFTTTDNVFTDSRDGKQYHFVTLGLQTWMAENLTYLPAVSPPTSGSEDSPHYYVYDYYGSSQAEAKLSPHYSSEGTLYNWRAAKISCPDGWHLPSDDEWNVLTDYLITNGFGYENSGSDIGKSMASTSGWTSAPATGTIGNDQGTNNSSGFEAFPNGIRQPYDGGAFEPYGADATFWSSTTASVVKAWYRHLHTEQAGLYRYPNYISFGFAVRCVKD